MQRTRSAEPQLSQLAGDYQEWLPAPELRWYVRCLWRNTLRRSAKPLLVIPDGSIDIIWTGVALRIAGPDTGPIIEDLPVGASVFGIRFWPGAALRWLGVPASALRNRRLPLEELWGTAATDLADRLFEAKCAPAIAGMLERSLRPALNSPNGRDRVVRAVLGRLGRDVEYDDRRIKALAAELDLNERTLRRYCVELVGFGPKTLDRILRFQHLIASTRASDRLRLADLAALCGYADQPHLARELRALTGLTPTQLVAQLP